MFLTPLSVAICFAGVASIIAGHRLDSRTTKQGSWWSGFRGQEHIAKLDSSNFDTALDVGDAHIMFFKKYCPGSKAARGRYAKFAENVYTQGSPVLIGAVDCIESPTSLSYGPEKFSEGHADLHSVHEWERLVYANQLSIGAQR